MPGYLAEPSSNAAGVSIIPSGNLSSSNIQSAIYELDSEKADGISVNNSLNTKAPINNPILTGTTVMTTASVANNLTVNGNTLFVDTVNNRVGIGNNSLTSQLHIKQQSGINDAIHVEGYNGGGAKIYRKESDGSIRFDAIQQGFSDIVFSTTPNSGTITERMKIDSSGRVTKPYQPAFRYHGFTINASGMQGGSAPLNIGSHLVIYAVGNANYSRFTAPIAGVYVFGISLLTNTGSGRMELIMRKNGSTTFDGYNYYAANDFSGEYTDTVNTYLISLQANDYIDWTLTLGTSYTSDMNRADRQFWGYLLG